ncbi:TELO2-interacting protein 2-like isoform X1 [Polyodon spathula]|uniref:TELO2-interacting protein 2-like isoform X1 n=1 Tax=Polyodon spathula TaxID=7913 RepID=UPI001B7E2296|nr:TELO2-interacting protein 2-like isoform X1 [Polyodon spathula]XP_041089543.1 TELO2-interacting protein 2-like isoform X1 [Polyodon spathula]
MDLPEILNRLQLSGETDAPSPSLLPGLPVAKVLSQIQELLQDEKTSKTKEDVLQDTMRLFESADSQWLFSNCCHSEGSDLGKVYVDFTGVLVQYAALPHCETESEELSESWCSIIPGKACTVAGVLLRLVRRLGAANVVLPCSSTADPVRSLLCKLLPPVFVFCAAHMQGLPWTNVQSELAARELLAASVQTAGCETLTELLCGKSSDDDDEGILGAVLELLKPEMKKETWKLNQATKHVFSWTLIQVSRPWLCAYLDWVFPPSLLISDDYRTENKVLGVHCLHHIVLNVPAAALRQFNRAHVLYHALFNHLYTPEAHLIQAVLPCLLDLLSVLEKPPQKAGDPRKATRYDEVLRLVLTHMEMEHKIPLRRVYARNIPPFIERLGIVIVRHLKRLERVIVGYLEVYDGPEEVARLYTLQALENTIQHAWPRMASRLDVLVKSLLRLIYDVSTDCSPTPQAVREDLLQRAVHCLILLHHCCDQELRTALAGVHRTCPVTRVLECIEKVQQDTQ